MPYKQRNNYLL